MKLFKKLTSSSGKPPKRDWTNAYLTYEQIIRKETKHDNEEWKHIARDLKHHYGSDMTTTFRPEPVPMHLCSVCMDISVIGKGFAEPHAVRSCSVLFSNHYCDLCSFFARVVEQSCSADITQSFKLSTAPMRLVGRKDISSCFKLQAPDNEVNHLDEYLRKSIWVISITILDAAKDADYRRFLEEKPMDDVYHDFPEFRILRPKEATQGTVSISLIKTWIDACDCDHTCIGILTERPKTKGLLLIDVTERSIVAAPDAARYLILSYAWDNVHRETGYAARVHEDGSLKLPPRVPSTIEDAITLTRLLDVRYLWVDVYCIEQQDLTKKIEQINQMDTIFQGAYLTIVPISVDTSDTRIVSVSIPSGLR